MNKVTFLICMLIAQSFSAFSKSHNVRRLERVQPAKIIDGDEVPTEEPEETESAETNNTEVADTKTTQQDATKAAAEEDCAACTAEESWTPETPYTEIHSDTDVPTLHIDAARAYDLT